MIAGSYFVQLVQGEPFSVNARGRGIKEQNTILGLWDSPILKDWIAYVAVVGVIAGIPDVVKSYRTVTFDAFGSVHRGLIELSLAFFVDLAFAVGVQLLLFGIVPAVVRRAVRSRRSRSRQIDDSIRADLCS
jgi:hypothetical protein